MTIEDKFIASLEVYLGYKLDEYGKKRIVGYLDEYRDELPEKIIVKKKVITRWRVMQIDNTKITDPRPPLTEEIMDKYGKLLCEKYHVDFGEFRKARFRKSRAIITDVRRIFTRHLIAKYRHTRKQFQEYFSVDHTTISNYVNIYKTPPQLEEMMEL